MLGPVAGGWLTDNYSWRWVFYINIPIGKDQRLPSCVPGKFQRSHPAAELDIISLNCKVTAPQSLRAPARLRAPV